MKTEFDGLCPTPSAGGNHAGLSGGEDIANTGPGGPGLLNSPWTEGICPTPGGKETSSSELGTTPTRVDVTGGSSGGSGIGLVDDHQSDQTFKTGQ
jgi:hypothetical protein